MLQPVLKRMSLYALVLVARCGQQLYSFMSRVMRCTKFKICIRKILSFSPRCVGCCNRQDCSELLSMSGRPGNRVKYKPPTIKRLRMHLHLYTSCSLPENAALLSASTKLRNANLSSSCLSVCPSVRPNGTSLISLTNFYEIWCMTIC